MRIKLIDEELKEFRRQLKIKIDSGGRCATDILYITYGAGHAFGIDLDKCFHEVQNSNMSKLDENGSPIYNKDGKVMKGPKYFKPDLKKILG